MWSQTLNCTAVFIIYADTAHDIWSMQNRLTDGIVLRKDMRVPGACGWKGHAVFSAKAFQIQCKYYFQQNVEYSFG